VIRLIFENLDNLAVNRYGTTNDPQYGENGDKNASGPEPFIQIQSYKKTEDYTTRHCEADLHNNGKVLGPNAVFFVVENHFYNGLAAHGCNYLIKSGNLPIY
jgi:hypothetical protein